ncbi:HNH endonuclease signature motif containing protein [Siminovitchia fortis]|uniref:Putative HNH nuclease YajD n=1 Tax=Siminovitchia fortis TaxID=254758 RepID=A0A443IMR7_9BACI|nr:HNH endonuclease signature motif containing protein [Siminovitchia fortis]RWR06739.1 HNH endonuclease [Siminovitchia fortis]WHY83007.1 HNH endonuclease signature motif containing protein [Siminovitchia fortis]
MAEYKAESHRRYDKHKRDQGAKKFYNSKAWQVCRSIALARDNYLCQECLKQGKITPYNVVHHIKSRKEYPELALDVDNLICVCHKCHNESHPEKGKGKENKKQTKRKIKVVESKPNREII